MSGSCHQDFRNLLDWLYSAVLPLQQTPGWTNLLCGLEPAIIKFLTVFWWRSHLLLAYAVCSITMLPILVCLLILSHKAVPLALCHWIQGPFCPSHAITVLPFPLLLIPCLCYCCDFSFPQKEMEGTFDQKHHSPITDHATLFSCSFTTSPYVVDLILTYGCLYLQLSSVCISNHLFVTVLLSVLVTH